MNPGKKNSPRFPKLSWMSVNTTWSLRILYDILPSLKDEKKCSGKRHTPRYV
jgi:hypothetical protein